MKTRYYVLVAALTYLLALGANLPAVLVLKTVDEAVPQIEFNQISGTLWQGRAERVTLHRQHTLEQLSWDLQWLRLLTGEASAAITAAYHQATISGEIAATLSGSFIAREVTAQFTARQLAELANVPLGEFAGRVDMQLHSAHWQSSQLPVIIADMVWHDAAITLAETARLGTISINIQQIADDKTHASINNRDGDVKLEGTASVGRDGAYELGLNLQPNPGASPNLQRSLALVAKPGANGSYVLNRKGHLKQIGLM